MKTPPSTDYEKTIRVNADPGALFDALTSLSGLAAWWTDVTGSGDAGGDLTFWFDPPEPCVMHVDQATRPTSVHWTVTACDFLPDWVGTRPTFTITPVDWRRIGAAVPPPGSDTRPGLHRDVHPRLGPLPRQLP